MAVDLGTLFARLQIDSTSLDATTKKAAGMKGDLEKTFIGAGLAVAGFAAASVKMAGDFQTATTQLVTGAGESVKNIDMIRTGILSLAGQVGQTPIDLAKGLYMIESAGYHGAAGLNVLKVAAEGAKVGNADLATVADAVTTALNAYHLPASDAAKVTNDLITAVSQGKTHLQDLAGSLGAILPIAAVLHVPLEQVTAAMATMTVQGTDAAKASQSLRFLMAALAGPTKGAATEMTALGIGEAAIPGITKSISDEIGKLGLHTSDVAATLAGPGGLPAALKMITDALQKQFPLYQTNAAQGAAYEAALKSATGGTRGFTAALELTGANMKTFTGNIATISGVVKNAGDSVSGWTLIQDDFNQKIDAAKATLDAFMIQIGTKLLPILGQMAEWFATNGIPMLQSFGQLLGNIGGVVIPPIVAVLGFLADHLWLVEAALAAVVLRFTAIKALNMLTWIKGMSDAFAAFAGEQGIGRAILALGGEQGGSGLNGALTRFRGVAQGAATDLKAVGTTATVAAEGGVASLSGGLGAMAGSAGPFALVGAAVVGLDLAINNWSSANQWQQLHDNFLNQLQTPGTHAYEQLHDDNLTAIRDLEQYAGAQGWQDIVDTARKTYGEVLTAHVDMVSQLLASSSLAEIQQAADAGALSKAQIQALNDYQNAYKLATVDQSVQAQNLAKAYSAADIVKMQADGLVTGTIAHIALQLQAIPGLLTTTVWQAWAASAAGQTNSLDTPLQNVQKLIANINAELNAAPGKAAAVGAAVNNVVGSPDWQALQKQLNSGTKPPAVPQGGLQPINWGWATGGVAVAPDSGGLALLHGTEFIVPAQKASLELQSLMLDAIDGRPSLAARPGTATAAAPSHPSLGAAPIINQHFTINGGNPAELQAIVQRENATLIAHLQAGRQ